MKYFLVPVFLFLASCASHYDMSDVERRIQLSEERGQEEIQQDLMVLIRKHPELSEKQKDELEAAVHNGFQKHQDLKAQERSVIQLLLREVFDPQGTKEMKTGLEKKLIDIDQAKARNIEELVQTVATPLQTIPAETHFERDFGILIREFR